MDVLDLRIVYTQCLASELGGLGGYAYQWKVGVREGGRDASKKSWIRLWVYYPYVNDECRCMLHSPLHISVLLPSYFNLFELIYQLSRQ